jgi:pyruvate/2-oxoglutarate dehydrogenase complex dihydrolipoamide dehydrogenase (E3) component
MSRKSKFDIIVIGAGAGGLNIASFMNRVGLKVLLIDKSDRHIGGDCLNNGCVPSKALIHAARIIHTANKVNKFGLNITGDVDWGSIKTDIQSKQDFIRTHENAEWFRSKGIEVVLGEAKFASKNSVIVDGVEYFGKKIVIATGSRPRKIEVKGVEQVAQILTNENLFTMAALPKRLLVLGAGPIGIEMAQALTFLGVEVTVADPGSRILGREDSEVAGVLQNQMEMQGIKFLFERKLLEFDTPTQAVFEDMSGKKVQIEFDAVLVSIGRVLNNDGLMLEKANIKTDKQGKIVVDSYLRTSNHNVLVCGDVAGNYQFTHAAEMHAQVILKNLFSPLKKKFNADSISWTTYTFPEIATFGLSEAELQKRKIPYEQLRADFKEDDRAIVDEYQYGISKIFVNKNGKILGGTMVAPNAGELVSELVLAMNSGLTVKSLFQKTYAYPTATRINKRLVAQFLASKLTKTTTGLLRALFRFL